MRVVAQSALVAFIVSLSIACGGGSGPEAGRSGATPAPAAGSGSTAPTDKNAYPVFPNADSGADPSVPAEQGGKGFTGEGWDTNTDFDLIGDPRAVKGGTFTQSDLTDFPSTLRLYGPNASAWDQMVHGLAYETLLGLHPTTLAYIPALATHWQISADRRSFRFRLNPNARWSDGMPVTSADVVASWKLVTDQTLQDPARTLVYSNFEQPVAESKYIVSVKAKTDNWQNLLYFSGLYIFPAHVLTTINGDAYIKQYNYKLLPGTGPYTIAEADVIKGKSITIRRRKDYWAQNDRRNIGTSNFDEIRQIVVRDRNLMYEMLKKGDLDIAWVERAQMWAEELNYPNITRGLNQKRKVFTHNPRGMAGMWINMRREPYTDVRVRKALRHLYNRELLIEKMMFNQYVLEDSIFPGSVYENPNNEKVRYDPQKAIQLLAEAGWKDRDGQGRLVRNGQPLAIEIAYAQQASKRYFTIYQEDLRKIGITLNLRFVTFETLVKMLDERTFGMVSIGYTGEVFPSPETSLLSRLADEKNTNNITGFKSARADEIIDAYNKEFDFAKRVKLLQELDGIVMSQHIAVFEWTAPYERFVYWNKFGHPKGYLTRIGDIRDVPSLWWIDPALAARLEQAIKDPSINIGEGPSEDKYWLDFAQTESAASPASGTR